MQNRIFLRKCARWSRLDRLGRSMPHLVTVIEELLGRQVGFRALCDGAIDTTTASGELIFHIFSALAQFERRLIQERTRAGLEPISIGPLADT
jgi:DNA invertase Pin-like site-specific DNA recombinase